MAPPDAIEMLCLSQVKHYIRIAQIGVVTELLLWYTLSDGSKEYSPR